MTYPCLIFDLDGTLAYTIGDLRSGMNAMLRHFGFSEVSEQDILANINFGSVAFVRGCLPEAYRKDDAFIAEAHTVYSSYYAKCYLDTTVLYPGVAEGIAYLKKKGVRLAVFSNKQDAQTKAIVSKLFPANTFELVMGHDGTFPHKPSPEGTLHIVKQLGATPARAALIGDSDVDMMTAKNAGLHPIGVSWGYRPTETLLSLGAERILTCGDDLLLLA